MTKTPYQNLLLLFTFLLMAVSGRNFFAFVYPGLMVAVGYMDPGNWATDIAGGSQFGYTLLSVILLSNIFALSFNILSLKLGIAAEKT